MLHIQIQGSFDDTNMQSKDINKSQTMKLETKPRKQANIAES